MTGAETFQRAHELFNDALERDEGERHAFVREVCGHHPELERRVRALLLAHDHTLPLVDEPDPIQFLGTESPEHGALEGAEIGPYRLLHELGAGGMGIVYEAEQTEPIVRRVALKVIKPGMDTREVTRRFEQERQTLASLEHPHIARAYDAGVTSSGRPYFVMEVVKGQPITRYCDDMELGLEARLQLFVQLCRAVQYAHLRGIIHRDLKPTNVLVSVEQDGPAPKVIDFGIAKALEPTPGSKTTQLTRVQHPMGSPQTMSPEQAMGQPVDIRADVYSAGVILYRLLTGSYPFQLGDRELSDWSAVVRTLSEQEPPPPSSRARAATASSSALVFDRELDWVVLKALAKEPGERYQSMEELARDVERYLHDQTVLAGPVSWRYRARKFVRRHRTAVTFAATVVTLMVASGVGLGVQAVRLRAALDTAERERTQAEQVTRLMTGIFSGSDPRRDGERDVTALELLDQGEEQTRVALRDQPLVLAELLLQIGTTRHGLGDEERGATLLEESISLARSDADQELLARSLIRLGRLRIDQGQLDAADRAIEEGARLARTLGDVPFLIEALQARAEALRNRSRLEEARSVLQEAASLAEGCSSCGETTARGVLFNLALVQQSQGRNEEALAVFSRVLDAHRRSPTQPVDMANVLDGMGVLLTNLGRSDEALPYFEEALGVQVEHLGESHSKTLQARGNMALAASNVGNLELAYRMNLENLRAVRSTSSEPTALEARLLNNIGLNQHGLGDLEAAEASFREAIDLQHRLVGDDHPNHAFHLSNLARLIQEQGRTEEAERHYRHALALRERHLPADHPNISDTVIWLGSLLLATGRAEEAEGYVRRGVEIRESKLDPQSWRAAEARSWLGSVLIARGRAAEGLPLVVDAYPLIREQRGDHWHRTPQALARVIEAYQAVGDEQQVAHYSELLRSRHPDLEPPGAASTRSATP